MNKNVNMSLPQEMKRFYTPPRLPIRLLTEGAWHQYIILSIYFFQFISSFMSISFRFFKNKDTGHSKGI